MAVKVMVAPVIATGEVETGSTKRKPDAAAKPRRRRSSVYDADGNEVFIILMCLKCHKMRPLAQFGLRRMADGAIRNQPWCRPCRSAAGADKPRRPNDATGSEGPSSVPEPAANVGTLPAATDATAEAVPEPRRNVAAEIAAALAAGMRRG